MAKIYTVLNDGNTAAHGRVGVNSRNVNAKKPLNAIPYAEIGTSVDGNSKIDNIGASKLDFFDVLSALATDVVMIEAGMDYGTSIMLKARDAFSVIIQNGEAVNGSPNDESQVIAVADGNLVNLFKNGDVDWLAEIITPLGARSAATLTPVT